MNNTTYPKIMQHRAPVSLYHTPFSHLVEVSLILPGQILLSRVDVLTPQVYNFKNNGGAK